MVPTPAVAWTRAWVIQRGEGTVCCPIWWSALPLVHKIVNQVMHFLIAQNGEHGLCVPGHVVAYLTGLCLRAVQRHSQWRT